MALMATTAMFLWVTGVALGAPVDISATNQNATGPRMAVDAAGDAVVVWQVNNPVTRNHTVQAVVSPAGGSFGAPVDLSGPGEDATGPQVAVDPAGDAVVVWDRFVAKGDFVVRAVWRPAGGAFGPPVDVSGASGQTTSPQIGIDGAGDVVVVWSLFDGTNHVIEAALRSAAGGTWQPLGAVSAAGEDGLGPHLAVDQAGDALVVWERFTGGADVARAAWRTAGGGFAAPVDLSPPGEDAEEPQVAVDGAGDAVVIWAGGNGSAMTEATSSSPGGAFTGKIDLSAPGVNRPLAVAVGPGGGAVAAWAWNNGSELQAVARPPGGSFGSPVTLSAGGSDPQAAIDARGGAVVVWEHQNGAIRTVQAAAAPASGTFGAPVDLSLPGQDASDPQASFDLAGHPYYVWLRLDPSTGNEIVQALLPPPPPGPPPPPPPPPGCNPCRLSALRVSPHTFSTAGRRVAGRCVPVTRANARRRHCIRPIVLRVSFDLPANAAVRITINKLTAGRLVAGRCVVMAQRMRRHRRCTRRTALRGAITRQGRAGPNRFLLAGRVGRRRLQPASYQLIATPVLSGQPAAPVATTFKIVAQ
jgi:hypothetical protein